jgi:hypothetical protein
VDRRATVCFDPALDDVGLPGTERLRQVPLDYYFVWARTATMECYHESADD